MRKTNPHLVSLVQDLRKRSWEHDAPIWRDIAKRLEKPNRVRSEVNVSTVDRTLDEGETAAVPGKLLGAGTLTKGITVAAFNFSRSAREKVEEAGGECLTLPELAERNPAGTGIRILG